MLINRGADIQQEDLEVGDALAHAIYRNRKDNCKFLIQKGCDPLKIGQNGKTLPHSAVSGCKNCDFLPWLIQDIGIPVDALDSRGNTPLIIASEKVTFDAIKILLKFGANPNIQNKKKETALHRNIRGLYGSEDGSVVAHLLDAGADPRIKNSSGKTPFDYIDKTNTKSKSLVSVMTKALKEWENKPSTVQEKPQKQKKISAKPQAIVPLKKEVTLPNIINLNHKPDMSLNDQLSKVHDLCGVILPDYDAFITQYGKGVVSGGVRVYPPNDIVRDLEKEFRLRWAQFFLWDDEESKLDDTDLAKSTILADTLNGDEFVWYPGHEEDKKKKAGIYVLPRDENAIKYVGKDLGDIFKYARKLLDDFPKENFWFEGYIDRVCRSYVSEKKIALKDLTQTLLESKIFDHAVTGKNHALLLSTKAGGTVDIDSESKEATVICDKDADITIIEKILHNAGFRKTNEANLYC